MGRTQVILKGNTEGLDTKSDELNISPKASPSLDGVVISQNGSISTLPGREIVVPSNVSDGKLAGRPVKYQTVYMDDSGAQAVEVPILYADDGSTAQWFYGDYSTGALTSLGTVTANGDFVNATQFLADLIIASNAHIPKKSASLAAIGNLGGYPPNYTIDYVAGIDKTIFSRDPSNFTVPTMPGLVEAHVNSVWLGSRDFLGKSIPFASGTWTGSNTDVYRQYWLNNPGDNLGDYVQIKRWNDYLALFKQRGIYLLEGTHPSGVPGSRPFNPIKTPASVGLAGCQALDYVLNDILFADSSGYLQLLSAAILKETAQQKPVSEFIQSVLDDIPTDERKNIIIRSFPRKNQVWVAYNDGSSLATSGQNNCLAIWDYRLNNWTKASNILSIASMLVLNNQMYTGTYDGAIHKQYSGTTHGLETRIASYYFPWINPGTDFSIPSIDLTFTGATPGLLKVQVIFDTGIEQYYDIVFNANDEGVYDVSNWDEVYYSSGAGRPLIKKTIYPVGSGSKAQIRLYSSQEDFAWTFLEGVVNIDTMGNSEI